MTGVAGQPAFVAVSDTSETAPTFFVKDGITTSGPLSVSAALAPRLTAATLRVEGRAGANAVQVHGTPASRTPGLTVASDDSLFLGPTAIYGGIQPGAGAVLELGHPAPGQALVRAFGAAPDRAQLLLKDGALSAPRTQCERGNALDGWAADDCCCCCSAPPHRHSAALPAAASSRPPTDQPCTRAPQLRAAVGGDVTVGAAARGQQRGLTVTGRLGVKQDALCEWLRLSARAGVPAGCVADAEQPLCLATPACTRSTAMAPQSRAAWRCGAPSPRAGTSGEQPWAG